MRQEYKHSLILCKHAPTAASSVIHECWRALLQMHTPPAGTKTAAFLK
jgi:hypothetical protein